MAKTLEGKVAIVTGASRGIGRAVAERLGQEGASVGVNYTGNLAQAKEIVAAIEASGSKAVVLKADITKQDEVQNLFQEAEQQLGPIDIVINVAGVSVFKPLVEVAPEDFEKVFAVNARGAFFVLQEATHRVRDHGRIIHFSTGGTKMPMAAGGVYAGSKAAGELIALSLAKELGSRQINVNVISPGVTETEGLIMPKQALDQLVAQTPLGRLGQPVDVARAVAFLAGPDAAWITGQVLQVNGGIL